MANIVIPCIFVLIALAMVVYSFALHAEGPASWPTARGKIRSAKVEEEPAFKGLNYEVDAEYTYQVNGKEYEGSFIGIDYEGSRDAKAEQALCDRMESCESWPVRYNPEDPSASFLDYQTDDDDWPTTPGKIREVSVVTSEVERDASYAVTVEYTYEVDRQELTGNCLAFEYAGSSDRAAAEALRHKLLGAGHVVVRYDPDDPPSACLSFASDPGAKALFLFGMLILCFLAAFAAKLWLQSQFDPVLVESLQVQAEEQR